MGILDLMLGRTAPGEQGVEGKSYTLPKSTHDFVYPIAVRRGELEAFDQLLEAEAEESYLDGGDDLQDVLDNVFEEHNVDAEELVDRNRQPRVETESILETWREQVSDDLGVVYARPGAHSSLLSFVTICKRRDADTDDPFELPESFPDAAALLTRLAEATEDQYRAVVHTDLLPDNPR